MRVAFPWMGDIETPLAAAMAGVGCDVIETAKLTADVVDIGARLAPEGMCIPFKLTLGTMYRNLEAGADALVYASGNWSCRFGYYGPIQAMILRDHGFKFRLIELRWDSLGVLVREVFRLSGGRATRALLRAVRALRLGWAKSATLDRVDARARRLRPLADDPVAPSRIQNRTRRAVSAARTVAEVRESGLEAERQFAGVRLVRERPALRVRVVGESYCVLEPQVNHDTIRRLGEMGVWADPFETAHAWLGFHSQLHSRRDHYRMVRAAAPYWRGCVGGEDESALGWLVLAARAGYDGVVHLHPFACMPSTAVGPVLEQASRELDIPLLSLSLDEHTSETGLATRLEAFVSMLGARRRQRKHSRPGI